MYVNNIVYDLRSVLNVILGKCAHTHCLHRQQQSAAPVGYFNISVTLSVSRLISLQMNKLAEWPESGYSVTCAYVIKYKYM